MKLEYSYSFCLEFDTNVSAHQFAMIAKPHRRGQLLEGFELNLNSFDTVFDGFDNEIIFGSIDAPHKQFLFDTKGVVTTTPASKTKELPLGLFLQSTKLSPFCQELSKYDKKLNLHSKSDYEKALFVTSFIFEHFTYERGHTHTNSDIRDVIMHEKGVCQDFAHLMLAIMRLEAIPSRYVSGMADGEGESHAWVECFIDGEWIGFDPTHNCETKGKPYIVFSVGRDYSDCTPNSGIFVGSIGWQKIQVNSKVTRID